MQFVVTCHMIWIDRFRRLRNATAMCMGYDACSHVTDASKVIIAFTPGDRCVFSFVEDAIARIP